VWPLIVAKLQAFADAAGLLCLTVSVDSTCRVPELGYGI
jgi:hypothetical protein